MIIDILIDKILEFQNPTVVGLDPRLEYIPIEITAPIISRLGKTPEAAGQAILAFNKGLIDAIFDIV
ncbi:MAG: orotidine 5'-phosphate decarboxylase, partial [Defluviitaleaceae bacterium]|nr:orotidine 5'-phosphate decarboxylase [Defluviitaleaceae bacterium]